MRVALRSRLLGLPALLLLLTAQRASLAGDLFVNNADPACGGQAPCFASIQEAVDEAQPGDRVQIQAGVYFEQVIVEDKNNHAGAGPADEIVIGRADDAPPDGVILMGQDGGGCKNGAVVIEASRYVTIRGLVIRGYVGPGIELSGGSKDNRGVHIEGNRIFGNGSSKCGGGIVVGGGNPDTLVVNNLIYSNGGDGIAQDDECSDGKGPKGNHDDEGTDDDEGADDEDGDDAASEAPHYLIQNTIHGNAGDGVVVSSCRETILANNAVTTNGTRPATKGKHRRIPKGQQPTTGYGVRRAGPEAGAPPVALLNNLLCGNFLAEVQASLLDGDDFDNLTTSGNEGPGVVASPECLPPDGVYQNRAGADGKNGTLDDDFTLRGPGPGLPSPAIDRGMDPRTLGLDPAVDPVLLSDFKAPEARPVERDVNRPLDFDIGALELACGCFEHCERCEIVIGENGTSDKCELSYNAATQCCNRITGAVSSKHLGEAYDVCPGTRSARTGFDPKGNADGCSAVPDSPLVLCPDVRFGCDFDGGAENCPKGVDLPCNNHDFCYQTCNVTKEQCDNAFFDDMVGVCDAMTPAEKALCNLAGCLAAADTYFLGVQTPPGDDAYVNGQNRGCQCCQDVYPPGKD